MPQFSRKANFQNNNFQAENAKLNSLVLIIGQQTATGLFSQKEHFNYLFLLSSSQ